MTLDSYTVNGVDLRSRAWSISTSEGLQDSPEMRGDDVVVPGAHGALDPHANPAVARRRYGPGRIRFEMWLLGVDPSTGVGPLDQSDVSVYLARLDQLVALFSARQLTIVHPRTDGNRQCTARLASPIQPVRDPASPWFGRFVAECTIPGAFWQATSDTTVSTVVGGVATGSTIDLSALACTAPITDAQLRFGPGNNPTLTQAGTSGSYFAWSGVIASGTQLLANTGVPRVEAGTGTFWTPSQAAVAYGPGPSWFEFDPTVSPLAATLTHTGGGNMFCSVTARRRFLTS